MGLLDLSGHNVADSTLPNVGSDESDREYFRAAVRDGLPHVSGVEPISPGSKRLVLTFSTVVRDAGVAARGRACASSSTLRSCNE